MPADQPRAGRPASPGTPAMALLVEEGTEEEAIEMTGWWAGWLAG